MTEGCGKTSGFYCIEGDELEGFKVDHSCGKECPVCGATNFCSSCRDKQRLGLSPNAHPVFVDGYNKADKEWRLRIQKALDKEMEHISFETTPESVIGSLIIKLLGKGADCETENGGMKDGT